MCCSNNNRPRRVVYSSTVVGATGPRGPIGPTGPTGPTGPAGSFVTDALFAGFSGGTISAGSPIPLTLISSTADSNLSVSGNTVIVPAGTYIVTFGYNGADISADGVLSLSLSSGAGIVPNGVITSYAENGQVQSASKTIIFTAPSATTLGLTNTSGLAVNFTDAYITVALLS